MGARELGYNLDDTYKLLTMSTSGRKILYEEYEYVYGTQGRVSAEEADEEMGHKFKKGKPGYISADLAELVADFIELAHYRHGLEYEKMFDKYPFGKFVNKYGFVLGNYDNKLIEQNLL